MIYTSTQGGEARFFPDYFNLPNSRRLHPVPSQIDRLADGFREISYRAGAEQRSIDRRGGSRMGGYGLAHGNILAGLCHHHRGGLASGSPSIPEAASASSTVCSTATAPSTWIASISS